MTIEIAVPGKHRRITSLAKASATIVCLTTCLLSALWIVSFLIAAVRAGLVFDFAQEWTFARNFLVGLPVYLDYRQSLEIHLGGSASPPFCITLTRPEQSSRPCRLVCSSIVWRISYGAFSRCSAWPPASG